MKSIASVLTMKAALAAGAPLLVVALLAWPRDATAPGTRAIERTQPLALDVAPVKQAALDLAAAARALPPAAAADAARAPETAARRAHDDVPDPAETDAARIRALGALTARIYAARDTRRQDGKTGAELRKPFSFDELGGEALKEELALAKDTRLLVRRDGTVLGPPGAALPAGLAFDKDPKAHASVGRVDGVVGVRFCPYGELTCLVDLSRTVAEPAVPASAPTPGTAAAAAPPDTRALDAALAALVSSASTQAAARGPVVDAPAGARSLAPFWLAWGLALVVAVALLAWLATSANALAERLVGVVTRLNQAAGGRTPDAAPQSALREIALLHDAVTAAARGVSSLEGRAGLDERRRERAAQIADAIAHAAATRDLSARVRVEDVDDAALLALVDASNRLLESLDHTVLRWQSHAAATGSRAENARALEERAEALKPLPPLLSDSAQRLLRLAHVEGAPPRLSEELRALGEALGQRAKVAQSLMDALLLDLATERPQPRHDDALALLRAELSAFKTSESAPERVAALKDLPPAEIGERVAADRA